MSALRRRFIPNATRATPAIEAVRLRFRTLHPPRRFPRKGVRPPFQLDGLVTVSVARVRWTERGVA